MFNCVPFLPVIIFFSVSDKEIDNIFSTLVWTIVNLVSVVLPVSDKIILFLISVPVVFLATLTFK